jgi:hypothetical protein
MKINFFLVSSDPCADITCDVAGEACVGGVCKCGTGESCDNPATGAFCDADNNVCKCAQAVDACTGDEICTEGACGMQLINNT